jgi:hypothetical protein
MNAIVKRDSIVDLDGFNDFTDEVEGEEERASSWVIQGMKIKFNDPRWLDRAGQDITHKLLTVLGERNVVNKWGHDGNPLETWILAPGEKFPNFDDLNKKCPKSEWLDKFGKSVGPWSGQHVVYFIDEHYNKYTWPSPTSTIGSAICVRELIGHINTVRKVKGENVYPVVELSHTDFPTGYGLRQRPHLLNVKDWIKLGANQTGDPLPAPDSKPAIDVTPTSTSIAPGKGAPADAQRVDKPTAKEVTDDEIVF